MDDDENDEGIQCPDCSSTRLEDAAGGYGLRCLECDCEFTDDDQ